MRNKKLCLLLLLTSCGSQIAVRDNASNPTALEEVRIALLDVRQAYSKQQMDIDLLEEKLAKLSPKPLNRNLSSILETRIQNLEKLTGQIRKDLESLSSHAGQTTKSLTQYRNQINALDKRLKDIAELKGTLDSISKAINAPASSKTYKVRSGDSLEKIARKHHTTIGALKQANGLTSNTILIGQELRIPD